MKHMSVGQGEAAMTFREIDERCGWRDGAAHACFMNAIKKLRRHSTQAKRLAELVAFREKELNQGEPVIAPNPKYSPRLRDCATLESFAEMEPYGEV